MRKIPEKIKEAWQSRENKVIFSTVDTKGMPNSIYATCVSLFNDSTIIIADNYFNKTLQNILSRSKASVLFITKEGVSYQLKGSVIYHTSGEIFNNMKTWNPPSLLGKGAVSIEIEEIYSGGAKL